MAEKLTPDTQGHDPAPDTTSQSTPQVDAPAQAKPLPEVLTSPNGTASAATRSEAIASAQSSLGTARLDRLVNPGQAGVADKVKDAAAATTTATTTAPATDASARGAAAASSAVGRWLARGERTGVFDAIYAGLPGELKLGVLAGNFEAGFMSTFVPALIASVTPEDKEQLDEEFSSFGGGLKFSSGVYLGLHVGVVKDIASNLEGLWELVKLGYEYSLPGLTEKIIREAADYGADPEAYKKKKAAEAAYVKAVASGVLSFALRVSSDPAALIGTGEQFGVAAADYVSHWFHGEFMKEGPFWQGETIGSAIGMLATEIALLFLGPEEWIARGAAAVGRGVRVAAETTKLGRYIIDILKAIPEISKILEARKALRAAEEAAEASRVMSKVEKGADEASKIGKVAEDLGEAHPHSPGELPEEAPKVPEKSPEPAPTKPSEAKPEATPKAEPKPKDEPKAKKSAKEEAAAKKARQKEAKQALENIRKKKPARGSAGESWDYQKFPEGPGVRWKPGDPPNMPNSKGDYPGWDTIRGRYWKNLAHNELEARKAGAAMESDRLLSLGPESWSKEELNRMLKTGQGPKGFEIEHKDIPQRVVDMLQEAGFSQNDARRIGQLGDPQNLSPELREMHAVVDEEAASFRDRNPTLPASLDDRTANPLRSMTSQELENLIAEINDKHIDLGATPAGRELRQELAKEAVARGRRWTIP